MRCPSCGAISKKRSMKCVECGAFRNKTWVEPNPPIADLAPDLAEEALPAKPVSRRSLTSSPSLLEFPNPTRQAIPQWRKELGERVREVQERRAREASLEDGEAPNQRLVDESRVPRPLELLSKPSVPPTNPLVIAALRRIERAHTHSQFSGNTAIATMAAYEEQPAFDLELCRSPEESNAVLDDEPNSTREPIDNAVATQPERAHRLSVVSATVITPVNVPNETLGPVEQSSRPTVKPKRLIRDNDPALNYLDSVATTGKVEIEETRHAPVFFRISSAILDFVITCLMAAPVVAMVKLTELQWQDPRVIGFAASAFVVAAFLYLTTSTALTGRTFGMRLFSLRVVDARTGLIPTGGQAAGRALLYLLSLATAGVGLMFMFVDRERRTAHDRFTRTAVVRV